MAYKKISTCEVIDLNIVIKIIDGDRVIDFDSLSASQKKEYWQRLNEQAMRATGYEREKK